MAVDPLGPPSPPGTVSGSAPTVAAALVIGQSNAGYFIQGPDYALGLMLDGYVAVSGLPRGQFNPNLAGFGNMDGYALPQGWKVLSQSEDTVYSTGGDAGTTYGGVPLFRVGQTSNFLADNGGDPSTWAEGDIGRNVRRFCQALLTSTNRAQVPCVFWLHTESDSQYQAFDTAGRARYLGAVKRWMGLVRGWLGRTPANLPWFVGFPMPYDFGTSGAHTMIRSVFSELALDASQNFHVLVRQTADSDPRDGDGAHIATADTRLWGRRAAYAAARWQNGLYGSTVPAGCPSTGPILLHAYAESSTTTLLTVQHDKGNALAFKTASNGGTAANGRGWSVDDNGTTRAVSACAVVDATHLRITHAACTGAAATRGIGYCLRGERLYHDGGIYDNWSTQPALGGLGTDWRFDWPLAGTLVPLMASDTPYGGDTLVTAHATQAATLVAVGQTATASTGTTPPGKSPLLLPRVGRFLVSRSGQPLLSGGPNIPAPSIQQPDSALLFNMASARPGVPAVNDQFEYITYGNREWAWCFNHPLEGFAGVRWQPTWIRAEGFYGAWEPSHGNIFRAYRKGASGQDAQTLVLECGPNPVAIPVGDKVVLYTSPDDGNVDRTTALNLSGFNVPLRQKLTVVGGAASAAFDANGKRIVEVDLGAPLPAIDYTPPAQADTWWRSSTFQMRHWSFYSDASTKRLRHPLGWFRDISLNDILPNGGYVMLGGCQFIPTWNDWSRDYANFGASLIEELWRAEQQGLADTFGATDPRKLAVELENEPTRDWRGTASDPGYGDLLPDVWYGISRQIWGPQRTLVVKPNLFGSLDGLDEFDFVCPQGHNTHLVCHNYAGHIHWPNGVQAWESIAETDWTADKLAGRIAALGYKGGGFTELGVGTREWYNFDIVISDAERGRRLGRALTSLTNKGLYMFAWGHVGDDNLCVGIRQIDGHNIEAYLPGISPYARRAGITTT